MTTQICIDYIKRHANIDYDKDIIIVPNDTEPDEYGDEFMADIEKITRTCVFNILDYITFDFHRFDRITLVGLWYDYPHIICKPPPHLIKEFIEKSCTFAKSISIILPEDSVENSNEFFLQDYKCVFSSEIMEDDTILQIWSL